LNDLAAGRLTHGLMAKANPENGKLLRRTREKLQTDAGLVGRAWARREDHRVRFALQRFVDAQGVVAVHFGCHAEVFDVVHEVVNEAVVVIDNENHWPQSLSLMTRRTSSRRRSPSGGEAGAFDHAFLIAEFRR